MAKKNPATTIHIGTFRDSCASHGCPGCPSKPRNPHETKAHNYLLRSVRRDHLLDFMGIVHAGRVRVGGHGFPIVVKSNGAWAASCEWPVKVLESRKMIQRITYMDGMSAYELTTYGHAALSGALTALGRRLDTAALLDQIDKRWIY